MSAGRKNRLELALDGGQGALEWHSEDPEHLWLGSRGEPNQLAQRDPGATLVPGISTLPAGHVEGWSDALRTTIAGFYDLVRGAPRAPWVSSWEDGLREVALTEAILQSNTEQRWVSPAVVEVGAHTLRS
jgi:predicted dehydrogenase